MQDTNSIIEKIKSIVAVTQSCLTLCDPTGLHQARLPCPSPPPGVCSNSCPLNQSCHPTIWKDQNGNVIPSLSLFIVTGPMKMAYTFHILLKSFYVITGN